MPNGVVWPFYLGEGGIVMKKIQIFACAFLLIFIGMANANEEIFFDDFNDGDTEGWWLSPRGNWSIENGSLRQDNQGNGEDWVYGVMDYEISDQIIETKVNTQGYGGVVVWYKDPKHCIAVIIYPLRRGLNLNEAKDGGSISLRYVIPTSHDTWYKLRVNANSVTGELDIYIDDSYIFTYKANTMIRTGQSGVTSGNGGAYFDDFKITNFFPPAVSGCIKFHGEPYEGVEVHLNQKSFPRQITTFDADGCFNFNELYSPTDKFDVKIKWIE
jgi:hypothetical protein